VKNAPVRHRIQYTTYLAAKGLVRCLPHAAVRSLGRGLGRIGYRLARKRRDLALENLALTMPELSADERREVVRGCYRHFGAYFLEIVSISRFRREEIVGLFDYEGWEHLEAAEAAGKGYFLMTGHFGTWEIAAYALEVRLGKLNMVARPVDNPYVERDLARIRQRFGTTLIDKQGSGHRMMNAFRRGERVAIVIDQKVRASAGVRVPFFGQPAWTSPALAFLSIRTGAPALPLYCVPIAGGRYRMSIREPITPVGKGEEAIAALTTRYLESVEREIRRQPELWLWMHRRWSDSERLR